MANLCTIVVKTSFEGMHKYENAPEEVAFLRQLHRHMFFVEAEIAVKHDDRELEFILVKRFLNAVLKETSWPATVSCEQIAKQVCKCLRLRFGRRQMIVSVYEDNENGAKVYYGH